MKIGLDIFDQTLAKEWEIFLILRHEDRFFTTEELSATTNLTISQVLKIVTKLINDLEDFGTDTMEVVFSKGKGARFVAKELQTNPRKFLIFLVEETLGFKLLKSILNEDYVSTSNFSYENFVSDSTVRRQLNKFRDNLHKFDLEITRSDALLSGNEKQARLFLNMMLWRIYAGEGWPFEAVNELHIDYLATNILKESGLSLTPIQKRQLMFFLAIGIIRRRNNHYVEFEESWGELTDNNAAYTYFKDHIRPFASFIDDYPGEVALLFFLLIIQSENLEVIQMLYSNFEENKKNNSFLYQATQAFYDNVSQDVKTIPEDLKDVILLSSFSYHLFTHLFKNFSTDISGYDYSVILDTVLSKPVLPNLKKNLLSMIRNLYDETKLDLFLEEDYLVTKYALILTLIKAQTYFEPVIKIKISTDLPLLINLRLQERINNLFGSSYRLEFLNATDPDHGDILLTNISLPRETKDYEKVNIVYINRNLTVRNIIILSNVLYDTSKQKSTKEISSSD
jgi:hypothetical protein